MGSLRSRVVLGAAVAAAVMVRGPAIVEAQPGPGGTAPTAAQKTAAKKLVDDGNTAYEAKDYDRAIDLYRQAFALIPHPILMFNIAQAHRLAGRPDQAVPFYERYLQLDPGGSEAAAARAALAEIKAAAETTKPGASPASSTEQEAPPKEVGAVETARPDPEEPRRVDAVERPGRTLQITGIVLGGLGVVGVGMGVYSGMRILQIEDDAKQAAMAGMPVDEFADPGKSAERNQFIGYAVGGALLVGGVVTYVLGDRKNREARTMAWRPVIGAGFAGVALSGSLP